MRFACATLAWHASWSSFSAPSCSACSSPLPLPPHNTPKLSPYMSDIDGPQQKKRKMTPDPQDKSDLAPVSGLLIKRHSDKARLPTRGSPLSAGYDLYRCDHNSFSHKTRVADLSSAETKVIPARGKALVDTQISVAVPAGTYGRVAPRSGLGVWSTTLLPLPDLLYPSSSLQVYDRHWRRRHRRRLQRHCLCPPLQSLRPGLHRSAKLSSCPYVPRAHSWTVNEGDRIAQLILERIVTPDVLEVQVCLLSSNSREPG